MNRIFAIFFFSIVAQPICAQSLIRTVDGKNYWINMSVETVNNSKTITAKDGDKIVRIPKSEIVLIEYEKDGLEILQPDKIRKVDPVEFDGDYESFLAKGKSVYIPLASDDAVQRSGSRRLRILIQRSKYFTMADCEDEADFILKYVFDDRGKDKACLKYLDRMGNVVLTTQKVNASYIGADRAGGKSVDKLAQDIVSYVMTGDVKGYIKKCIRKTRIKAY